MEPVRKHISKSIRSQESKGAREGMRVVILSNLVPELRVVLVKPPLPERRLRWDFCPEKTKHGVKLKLYSIIAICRVAWTGRTAVHT